MKWTNSYRSFGLKTKRSTGLKTIEHKHELSTWTLHQLDQLKEHEPERGRDLDRPEPEHPAPAREQHTPKRHGLGL